MAPLKTTQKQRLTTSMTSRALFVSLFSCLCVCVNIQIGQKRRYFSAISKSLCVCLCVCVYVCQYSNRPKEALF
jgi:F0F1-type ATP synthase assembly protein I